MSTISYFLFSSSFPSIERRQGNPVSQCLDVLKEAGDLKHMEPVALLKSQHGLGHGHANALVACHLARR